MCVKVGGLILPFNFWRRLPFFDQKLISLSDVIMVVTAT